MAPNVKQIKQHRVQMLPNTKQRRCRYKYPHTGIQIQVDDLIG